MTQERMRGSIAVVIDILRASTTIVHALGNGALAVIPCGEVETARETAEKLAPAPLLLGGERGGQRIDGFDLDNSPLAYTPTAVAGRTIVFTTTNGTAAVVAATAASAARVVIGAYSNLAAIVARLRQADLPIHLLCAGTRGEVTAEDVLFAGACVEELTATDPQRYALDVQAELAREFHRVQGANDTARLMTLRSSRGGLDLIQLGFDADIARAAERNLFSCVPELHAGRLSQG